MPVTDNGGSDVLRLVDLPEPQPGAGEIKVRLRAPTPTRDSLSRWVQI